MLGGSVGELPGGLSPGDVRTLEGTSDTTTRACVKMRPLALHYARMYNRVILKRQLRPISSADQSGATEDNSAQ